MSQLDSLPEPNATLTKVEGGGTTEDYDSDPGADTQKWAGSEGVYLREETERETTTRGQPERERGRSSEIVTRRVYVRENLGVDFDRGDTLTMTRLRDSATIAGRIRRVRHRAYGAMPALVRLELEEG